MRRFSFLLSVLAVVLLSAVAVLGLRPTAAQDATPAASAVGVKGVGVKTDALGSGQPDAAPGQTLVGRRNTYEPGGFTPAHHHPGALVVHVESGELTYTVIEGTVQVHRAATAGTPGPTEEVVSGQETVLRAGDWLFEQGAVHSVRNDGSEPTVVLTAALTAADQPFTVFHEMGTPAP
jgi:quercetin dioxygenase-like cupin family protein